MQKTHQSLTFIAAIVNGEIIIHLNSLRKYFSKKHHWFYSACAQLSNKNSLSWTDFAPFFIFQALPRIILIIFLGEKTHSNFFVNTLIRINFVHFFRQFRPKKELIQVFRLVSICSERPKVEFLRECSRYPHF